MRSTLLRKWLTWLRPPRGLIALTAAVVASFVVSIVYAGRIASAIDGMAYDIGQNSSPSVRQLSAARTELFTMVSALAGAFVDPSRVQDVRSTIQQAHVRLHQRLEAYLALPFFPEEPVQYATTSQAIDDAERAIMRVVDRLELGDLAGAESIRYAKMAQAIRRADDALQASVAFDAEAGRRLSESIRDLRKRAEHTLWGLGVFDVLLAVSLMEIARRASREYVRLRDLQEETEREMSRKLAATVQASVSVAGKISESAELTSVAQVIADQARSVLRADYAAVGLGVDPKQPFKLWVFSGMDRRVLEMIGRVPRPVGVLGAVPRRGEPLRLDDLTSSPDFRGVPENHPGVGAFLGVPIRHAGENVGNLYLARKPGLIGFSDQDERVATLLSAVAGVALQNADLNSALRRAIESREEVLALVSHDLRNPLNAIRLAAETLERGEGGGLSQESRARCIEAALRSARRMSRLIEDLLTAAKADVGRLFVELAPEVAPPVVDEAVQEVAGVASERSVTLENCVPRELPLIQCDRGRIVQVLINLLGNAVKFTPAAGRISVEARRQDDSVCFSVADTGPGISAEQLPHVFERYWQKSEDRRRGSGLGLYIVKAIVESHRGKVWVESEVGRGTTFSFTIPMARPASPQLHQPPPA